LLILIAAGLPAAAQTTVFINEIHYDNSGTDAGEAIEIAGPAGTDLTGWSIVLYNGNGGALYNTTPLVGPLDNDCSGWGLLQVPVSGLQNGAPDGIALVDDGSTVIQFLSYEGSFTATNGPAAGLTSTDIGVAEPSGTPVGHSLQLTGTGSSYEDFSWTAPAPNTFGDCNNGQTLLPPPVNLLINEVDSDTPGTDTLEFVELYDGGVGNSPLDGLVVVFMNGSDDASYAAFDLDGYTTDINGYFLLGNAGVSPAPDITFGGNGLQNGADAVALYQGDASDFPNDTPVTTNGLIDAIVYDTNDGDDAGLLVLLNAGQPQVNEGGQGDKDNHSNQRCPSGEGGARNTAGYFQATPSPAGPNQCGGPTIDLIINETDADTAGSDALEFVELYDGGVGSSPLDGFVVVFMNGSDDASYAAYDLDGFTTDASGYFVLGNPGVSPTPDIIFGGNGLQNGADAVALYWGDADDFLNDTPVTTVGLIDAIVYDTNDGDDAGLLVLLNAGEPQVNEDGAGDKDNHSNQRCPNGEGGARNTSGYIQAPASPAAENQCGGPSTDLIINETDADTPGSDSLEFVELYDGGAGNSPLDGLVVVFFNGNGDIAYNAFDLDGFATDANGYFLMGNPGVTPTPDITFGGNGLQNGADAVALYWGDAADFPNGTPVTTVGLIDAIVYDTNDSDDAGLLVLLNAGQPQVNEDGEGDKDNHSNQRCPNGEGGGRNTDPYLQRPPTPGAENWCGSLSVFAEIFEIQSAGAASPFDGATVTSLANVVTTLAPNGFFMQTPTDRSDGDINTSDGIFVFTGGAPGVAVGDSVDVTGEVDEFFGMTEITRPSAVTVVGAGVVQAVIAFDAFVPSPDPAFPSCAIEFECYEGMLIAIADGTVTGPNQRFGPDPVAEVHITAAPARTFREPGIEVPGLPGLPVWDGNPEIFELDPNKLGLPNQIIPAGSSFSAVGVLGFEFGGYELWPSQLTVVPAPLPRAVWPREPGEFTVATLNLFRLFDDIDDPPDMTYDPPRNDFVVPTAEYQLRLAKFSSHIREVLDAPDILAVQEAEKLGVLQDLAARIAADDPTISYTAYLVEGNDIGTIDVGFMVRDRIQVDAITQLGADETYVNPITLEDDILHDRPPLLLEGSCQLEFGSSPIAVLAVHMRSLSGIEGSDAERVRQKRFEQAESVAAMVQDIQTTDPGVRLIVAGDFNAYEFTDGYVDVVGIIKGDFLPADSLICDTMTCMDIVDPDLTDEILNLPAEERYSFIFRGTAQALDHALTSSTIVPEISAVAFGRGNADAAVVLRGDDGTEAPLPLRSSDHDGLVLYILNDEDDDGVPNDLDMCPGTVKPEGVPTQHLGTNRWALVDDDGVFDTTPPNGRGNGLNRTLTLGDTAGCSCEQIIEELDLGNGHVKFGCSIGVMENWMAAVGE
jgi:endonuclease/exonuclease/phosphatase family metal-dependent hydrolase